MTSTKLGDMQPQNCTSELPVTGPLTGPVAEYLARRIGKLNAEALQLLEDQRMLVTYLRQLHP